MTEKLPFVYGFGEEKLMMSRIYRNDANGRPELIALVKTKEIAKLIIEAVRFYEENKKGPIESQ